MIKLPHIKAEIYECEEKEYFKVSWTKADQIQCILSLCVCMRAPALNPCGQSYVHQAGPAVGTGYGTAPVWKELVAEMTVLHWCMHLPEVCQHHAAIWTSLPVTRIRKRLCEVSLLFKKKQRKKTKNEIRGYKITLQYYDPEPLVSFCLNNPIRAFHTEHCVEGVWSELAGNLHTILCVPMSQTVNINSLHMPLKIGGFVMMIKI